MKLYSAIEYHIDCVDTSDCLNEENKERMATSLTRFVEASVAKFIQGQKEHGGNITDKDLDKEIEQELIDSFWYNQARRWKGENEVKS